MASGIQYQNQYKRAEAAYFRGDYEQAAQILEQIPANDQTNPEVLLLKGHVYSYFEEFDRAEEQYNLVLENAKSEDYLQCARSGIENVKQWREKDIDNNDYFSDSEDEMVTGELTGELDPTEIFDSEEDAPTGIVSEGEDQQEPVTRAVGDASENPFQNQEEEVEVNPFEELSEDEITAISALEDEEDEEDEGEITNLEASDAYLSDQFQELEQEPREGEEAETLFYNQFNQDSLSSERQASPKSIDDFEEDDFDFSQFSSEEFLEEDNNEENLEDSEENTFGHHRTENQETAAKTKTLASNDYNLTVKGVAADEQEQRNPEGEVSESLEDMAQESPQLDTDEVETGHNPAPAFAVETKRSSQQETTADSEQALFTSASEKSELFASSQSQQKESDVSFVGDDQLEEPVVEQEQGFLGFLENAPLAKKQQYLAGAVGVASAIVIGAVSSFGFYTMGENRPGWLGNLGRSAAIGVLGGAASGAVTYFMGGVIVKQIKRSTGDLQAQLYAVQQGNLEAKATVYCQDELGQIASGFNQMTRVVSTTTKEAQQKAQEQEQAKEDLQRQVIRLLDDVEGAARGDLTVQAEVSADVLGAVADAFNLTIRNLRTIVQQVKDAAQEVNEGAAESESFAQGLSEDALRQAEELAVSLNSAQMMTDSIQRVADNAKEAESVARSASETALKGGEAVDSTVAGILQIRETVAQSTRKVKRLAESSQEISKIVSVISQIATRTNNLALNASIEAARAGEAGRGFAVIADEVRQLADRSTKSLREIEKIVLQIQSETSSVMIAMEEGTQQVIEGTQRAEQAKNALEEIIQVSNRIDSLVQSITADTVEQSETAQSVAQVMQSVEMTAQGTSQESQQVSTALQNLVSLAGDLLASVERFRVNPEEDEKKN
ncbi:MAG: methyl-accepting chemotaxis protein [Halothece sp.]